MLYTLHVAADVVCASRFVRPRRGHANICCMEDPRRCLYDYTLLWSFEIGGAGMNRTWSGVMFYYTRTSRCDYFLSYDTIGVQKTLAPNHNNTRNRAFNKGEDTPMGTLGLWVWGWTWVAAGSQRDPQGFDALYLHGFVQPNLPDASPEQVWNWKPKKVPCRTAMDEELPDGSQKRAMEKMKSEGQACKPP